MKQLHLLWLLICLSGFLTEQLAQQQVSLGNDNCYANSECLVKFKTGTSRATIDSLGLINHFSILEYFPDGRFYRVRIPASFPVQSFINKLVQNSAVEYAQPDYFISFFTSSHEQSFTQQWYYGTIDNGGSNFEAAKKVVGSASSDITISIIEDGFLPDSIPELFKNARTLPINISRQNRIGRISILIESIWQSLNNGSQIITINAGAPDSPLLKATIEQAFNRGVTIICAAADSIAQTKAHIFPAAYNQYCIAVTAHGYQGSRLNSAGGDYVDLSAPGEILFSKGSKSGSIHLSGSSVATLYVTASATMLAGIGINSYDKIRQALEQSCFDPPPKGWDRTSGWGFLDIFKAVQYFPKPDHDIIISGFKMPQWGIQGEQLQAIVAVKNQGNYVHDVTLAFTDKSTSKTLSTSTATIKPDQSSQFIFQWNTDQEPAGPHLLTVAALITGDEDLADNTQYKEITIVKDARDVEISGVGCTATTDEHSFISAVQIGNKGTYTEMVTIQVQNLTGTVLGQKSISIQPQLSLSIPVQCTMSDMSKEKFIKVTIETTDLQETEINNNSYLCPLIFSSK